MPVYYQWIFFGYLLDMQLVAIEHSKNSSIRQSQYKGPSLIVTVDISNWRVKQELSVR